MLTFSEGFEPVFVLLPLLASPSCWSQLGGGEELVLQQMPRLGWRPAEAWRFVVCHTVGKVREKGWKNEGKVGSSRPDPPLQTVLWS